jgi:uncharacterized protein with PQ loop repeat
MDLFKTIVEHLYAISGSLAFIAYLPQIITLLRNGDGAQGISLITWFMWVVALTINTLYAGLVNGDKFFLLATSSSLLGTLMVFTIAFYKRWKCHRQDKQLHHLP